MTRAHCDPLGPFYQINAKKIKFLILMKFYTCDMHHNLGVHALQNILACFTLPQSKHLEDQNETKMKKIGEV